MQMPLPQQDLPMRATVRRHGSADSHQQNQRRRQLLQREDDTTAGEDEPEAAAGRVQNLSADAALNAETTLSTTAEANTTTGVATAKQ